MASLKETLDSLDSVIQTIETKKKTLDSANAAAKSALDDYTQTVNQAQSLRDDLMKSLSTVLPTNPSNVRVMGAK